jgi:hypothetical protein
MNKARELTETEVRNNFLQHCWDMIDYWENFPDITLHKRMSGVVFSLLVALDGESADLPGFIVAPFPNSDDKEYNRLNGNNWYPENTEENIDCDIAGSLHEYFYINENK